MASLFPFVKTGPLYIPNPDWVDAEYEILFTSEVRFGISPISQQVLPIIFKREPFRYVNQSI